MRLYWVRLTLGTVRPSQGHHMTLKFFPVYHNTDCQLKLDIAIDIVPDEPKA